MLNIKRISISTLTGLILGVFCIVGIGQRAFGGEYLTNFAYLGGIWVARVLLGLMIGFVQDVHLVKGENWERWVNSGIRGALVGLFFSIMVLLLDNLGRYDIGTFFAGIAYGVIIDLVATYFTRVKKEKEKLEEKNNKI
ncbi:MAG: hypothetical protein ACTSYV_03610 [Candidatus Heimdallarchaeaceae archaeon]